MRFLRQCAREEYPLLLTAAQRADLTIAEFGKIHPFDCALDRGFVID